VEPASLAPDASFTCYGSLSWAEGQHKNTASASGKYDGTPYDDDDSAHYFGIAPEIDVEKSVYDGSTWVDADSEPGPSIMSGSDVLFQFVVENTGNVALSDVSLSDNKIASLYSDQALTVPCTEPDPFNPDASFTCYGSLSWAEGQHVNEATVTGIYGGSEIDDRDKAHYYGTAPEIDVEKEILVGSNWMDADSSPGPSIEDGGDVIFRFTVKNTGSVALSNLSLSDDKMALLYSDQNLSSPCVEPASLAPDASFTCYGSLSWAEGQHVNEATATGDYDGVGYDDTDKAHYFGINPSIDVEKYVWDGATWQDADTGTGPELWSDPVFKFVVTNDGNLALTNVQLSDSLISSLYLDEGMTTPCTNGITMEPDDSLTCYGTLNWAAGQHENTASVSGGVYGGTVDDTDKAHYFGPNPDIDVEKWVLNGSTWADADSATGPVIGSGSDVLFRFVVSNTGNVALSNVSLSDSVIANLYSDQALTTPCVESAPFGAGENFTCYGSLSWAAGQHQNTATASGSYDGQPTSDTDLAHYYGATVSIDVEKNVWNGTAWEDADTGDGPTLLDGTDPIFRFVVTNTSNVALTNVQLSDNKISTLYSDEALTTPCVEPASLAVSGSFTCYGSLPWASGNHENTATVSAESNGLPAGDTDLAHYLGGDPDVVLTKTADVDVFTQVGEIITYTFEAENTGNLTLYDVVISDPLPDLSNLDCSANMPATLTPGTKLTCTATYEVKQADIDAGAIANTASVEGTDSYQRTVEDDDNVDLEGPKEGGSIVLEKSADPEIFVAVDDVITYTFVATNNGTFTLSNVMIEDPLPDLSELVCEPTQPSELAPGESMTCTATYTITQEDINAGIVENTATVTGEASNGDEVEDSDDAVVEGPKEEASIHLDKKAEPATYENVGDKITYTFTVTNNGIYTLYDVTVTDPLFSLLYGPIDVFEPGDSMTYKYTYTITQADIDAGNIANVATAMGYGPDEDPVSSTDEALVDRPTPKEEEEEKLPATGFAPNQITTLPLQSLDQAYTAYSDLWLEIPSLGIQIDIVGVPETPSGWDVTWLEKNAGWLNGTTFPTWPGNSFVTGHVWDAYDQPGPFVDLNKLQWGDKVIVHLNGSAYTFEVRSKLSVEPDDLSLVEQEEDYSWLNLMTCKEFNEETGVYDYRLIVRTVLVGMD
jgi:LPXTG-site transpeptidase (sortase) family protein